MRLVVGITGKKGGRDKGRQLSKSVKLSPDTYWELVDLGDAGWTMDGTIQMLLDERRERAKKTKRKRLRKKVPLKK